MLYLVIALLIGLAMGVAGGFSFSSVHTRISLLGCATLSITALVYLVTSTCRATRLALAHFRGHNLGLPQMIVSLVLLAYGFKAAEKTLACGSMLVIASLVPFCINVLLNGAREAAVRRSCAESDSSQPPELPVQRYEGRRSQI